MRAWTDVCVSAHACRVCCGGGAGVARGHARCEANLRCAPGRRTQPTWSPTSPEHGPIGPGRCPPGQ
eukprot:2593769-Alexandrium_andersonii.AAC.1